MAWPFPVIWKSAPPPLLLGDNEVHLWLAAVPDCLPDLKRLREVLDAEERDRAGRFHFERDRERYTVARGVLRLLLSTYLGTSQFALTTNKFGKPFLQAPHDTLHFNVSHSRDLALFGFTRINEIGADVESVRPDFATLEIADRFFAPDEAAGRGRDAGAVGGERTSRRFLQLLDTQGSLHQGAGRGAVTGAEHVCRDVEAW
jgi:4'-phosphopantetheinyl transferase